MPRAADRSYSKPVNAKTVKTDRYWSDIKAEFEAGASEQVFSAPDDFKEGIDLTAKKANLKALAKKHGMIVDTFVPEEDDTIIVMEYIGSVDDHTPAVEVDEEVAPVRRGRKPAAK